MVKTKNDHEKILKVIKRIRDSFHESVATYTCGRCYHFAKILQEMFGGELYQTESRGHVMIKIGGVFYDIKGNMAFVYPNDDQKTEYIKMSKSEELSWEGNYHGAPTSLFMKKYLK